MRPTFCQVYFTVCRVFLCVAWDMVADNCYYVNSQGWAQVSFFTGENGIRAMQGEVVQDGVERRDRRPRRSCGADWR